LFAGRFVVLIAIQARQERFNLPNMPTEGNKLTQISLEDRAAIYLEEMHISGDTMITMDHALDDISQDQQGAYYLYDLLAGFVQHLSGKKL
jgi:hypothetical protein